MKKAFIIAVLVLVVTACLSSSAMAGGDKVRGENGQGGVNQVQVMDPPPFQP